MFARAPRPLRSSRVIRAVVVGLSFVGLVAAKCQNGDDAGNLQACQVVFAACPLQPATLAETDTCTEIADGPCANAALLYRSCVTNACTDAGIVDTAGIFSRCLYNQEAFQSCLDSIADAGVVAKDAAPSVAVTPTPTVSATTPTPAPTPTADAASTATVDAGSVPVDAGPVDAGAADTGTPEGDATL